MNLFSNIASSVTGKVDKALLCVRKPAAAKVNEGVNDLLEMTGLSKSMSVSDFTGIEALGGAISTVDLRAKLAAGQKGFLSSFTSVKNTAASQGYHVLEVKYNPSKIHLYSHGGNQMMPGPGGAGTSMQVQSAIPAMTTMQVELLFDDTSIQDAFMAEKFTNLTVGSAVTDVSGIVRNETGDGYTVQRQIEGILAMITQSETRQVVFYWGDMVYAGEVIEIGAKYTMFNPLGHPVRGTVSLTIREGSPSGTQSDDTYWSDAYAEMLKGKSPAAKIASAMGNIINTK